MSDIDNLHCSPFTRGAWSGTLFTTDGTPTIDFTRKELAKVLWCYESGDKWDGVTAGILKLKDGRIVSWETSYGPTGDGFSEDAYGGDADILCSKSVVTALLHGLTPELRKLASTSPQLVEEAGMEWLIKGE